MVERVAAEKTVAGILSVDRAVDRIEISVAAAVQAFCSGGIELRRPPPAALDALALGRMARKPARQSALPCELARPEQRREHVRHLGHIVARVEHVAEAELVGLPLVVAAVLQE